MTILSYDNYQCELISMTHYNRSWVENLIANKYKSTYEATVNQFAPNILLITKDKKAISLVGIREAKTGEQLYLENYLLFPIEEVLSSKLNLYVSREDIIEICNLTSFVSGGGILMIMMLCSWINQNGLRWVVCTGTEYLRKIFDNLNINFIELANAEKTHLSLNDQEKWGTYYQNNPVVIAINAKEAEIILKRYFEENYSRIEEQSRSLQRG